MRFGLDYTFYGRNYSDWSFNTSDMIEGGVKEYVQPWRIPSGGQWDFNANYRFKVGKCNATIYGNIDNLFDQVYISDATDAGNGLRESAYFFYTFGRTWSVKLKINF